VGAVVVVRPACVTRCGHVGAGRRAGGDGVPLGRGSRGLRGRTARRGEGGPGVGRVPSGGVACGARWAGVGRHTPARRRARRSLPQAIAPIPRRRAVPPTSRRPHELRAGRGADWMAFRSGVVRGACAVGLRDEGRVGRASLESLQGGCGVRRPLGGRGTPHPRPTPPTRVSAAGDRSIPASPRRPPTSRRPRTPRTARRGQAQ